MPIKKGFMEGVEDRIADRIMDGNWLLVLYLCGNLERNGRPSLPLLLASRILNNEHGAAF